MKIRRPTLNKVHWGNFDLANSSQRHSNSVFRTILYIIAPLSPEGGLSVVYILYAADNIKYLRDLTEGLFGIYEFIAIL